MNLICYSKVRKLLHYRAGSVNFCTIHLDHPKFVIPITLTFFFENASTVCIHLITFSQGCDFTHLNGQNLLYAVMKKIKSLNHIKNHSAKFYWIDSGSSMKRTSVVPFSAWKGGDYPFMKIENCLCLSFKM
jgi:hypothetical protein